MRKAQVKFSLERNIKAKRGSGGLALLFLTSAVDGGGWSTPRLGRFTPEKAEGV
jgi:hypothetical protein